jgi:hypothetical protein
MQVLSFLATFAVVISFTAAQTHQRLGGCPDLGCVFPPDQYVSRVTLGILITSCAPANRSSSNPTIGRTSLLVSSLTFVSRSTLRSTVPRRARASQTPTSPSPLPRRVKLVSRLRSTSSRMTPNWSAGLSAGMRVRIRPSLESDQLSNVDRSLR